MERGHEFILHGSEATGIMKVLIRLERKRNVSEMLVGRCCSEMYYRLLRSLSEVKDLSWTVSVHNSLRRGNAGRESGN